MDLSVTVARIGHATVIWTLVDIMTAERFYKITVQSFLHYLPFTI